MINIYDLYLKTLGAVNSHQAGFLPPNVFEGMAHAISMELFAEKFANIGRSQKLDDELAKPFLKTVNITLVSQPGKPYDLAPYPAGYEYHATSRVLRKSESDDEEGCGCLCEKADIQDKEGKVYKYEDPDYKELREKSAGAELCETNLEKIDTMRWQALCEDSFKKPSYAKPKMTQFDSGFKVAPKGIGIIVMDYFISPVKPVLAHTTGASDEFLYDAGNSVHLQWSETLINEFISRLKRNYGAFTRDQFMYQAGAIEKTKL